MFIVFLTFARNKSRAAELMSAHNTWIKHGLEANVFLLVGGLQPQRGGAIIAHNTTRAELEARVAEDPFVAEQVVDVAVYEFSPTKAEPRLAFLLAPQPTVGSGAFASR